MAEITVNKIDKKTNELKGDDFYYEIKDSDTRDGVYYLVVGKDKDWVKVYSVSTTGEPLYSDLLQLSRRVSEKPDNFDSPQDDALVWKKDLPKVIGELLGQTAANLVLKDLGLELYDGDLEPKTNAAIDFDNEIGQYTLMSFDFHLEREDEHTEDEGDGGGSGDLPTGGDEGKGEPGRSEDQNANDTGEGNETGSEEET